MQQNTVSVVYRILLSLPIVKNEMDNDIPTPNHLF